jgi:hypothetical protein
VAPGEVVGGIFLSGDHVIRAEQLTIRSGFYFI